MPALKISELPVYTAADAADADLIPIVDSVNGVTKKISISELVSKYAARQGVFYFGDANTDGSWRLFLSAPNLLIQVRLSGVWTTKDTLTPDFT